MLVIMSVDIRGHGCTIGIRLAVFRDVNLENPGKTDLELYTAVLVEMVVPDIFYTEVISAYGVAGL